MIIGDKERRMGIEIDDEIVEIDIRKGRIGERNENGKIEILDKINEIEKKEIENRNKKEIGFEI